MPDADQLVIFTLDDFHYAVSLSSVEKAIRLVDVTPLPKAPRIVLGVINMRGRIIPVLDIRSRFGLPKRDMRLGDQLVIARTSKRAVALVVDEVRGVVEYPAREAVAAEDIVPGMEYVAGVLKLADGMLFIHNLDEFLSLEEEKALEAAISGEEGRTYQ